ncbi:hypothetical protein K1X76_07525 [bacterium]|nr:hypothetical protein [bacterium]
MKVDKLSLTSSQLSLNRPITPVSGGHAAEASKSLGEAPPVQLSLSEIGDLASLFAATGLVGRLKKRLNYLKKKKCNVVPAQGTVACIDDTDTVFLGVEFLEKYQNEEETLAGVLAHEWGHSCALKPNNEDLQKMNWNEIFDLRRAHETLADEISGRLLFMMGYTTEGIKKFLLKGKETHNLKYHPPEMRAKIIEYGFEAEKNKGHLARELFKDSVYENEYKSILLDIS